MNDVVGMILNKNGESKLPQEFYVISGALVCGLIIWGALEKGPDGFQWFFAGAFSMGILMNIFRDKKIDKLSK